MLTAERRMAIYERLQKEGHVQVSQLAEVFGVSGMTIRRDLAFLEKQGVLSTSYGGATLLTGVSSEPSFSIKAGYAQSAKADIAKEASLLVKEGESVYLDCGTTTVEMIPFLSSKKITLVTNSWKAVSRIHDFSKMTVLLAPGIYDPVSEGALSSATLRFLKDYHIDKAFISTQGLDPVMGATVPSQQDAEVKRGVLGVAKQKILLADHGKFDQCFFASHGELKDFDAILTDVGLEKEVRDRYKQAGGNIILCGRMSDRG